MKEIKPVTEFDEIVRMIERSKSRAFQKVNEELVLLYFSVGKIVSKRVTKGTWGDKTVEELSKFVLKRFPELSGFNRRGLYRMKQFYETYSADSDCHKFWLKIQKNEETSYAVSLLSKQINIGKNLNKQIVSSLMTQISWTRHSILLSKTKTPKEKLYYSFLIINEKLTVIELERQINSAVFERSSMANQIVSTLPTHFPSGVFKDPYIFEFLDLPEPHSEKDLERALAQNLRKFNLEIGKGFTC